MQHQYSSEDVRILRERYGTVRVAELALMLGRSPGAITFKARTLGLTERWRERSSCKDWSASRKDWSESEVLWLRNAFPVMKTTEIARLSGRTRASIERKAYALGLVKSKPHASIGSRRGKARGPDWDIADVDRLRQIYPETRMDELVREFGRSAKSIENKARKLGLSKSPEYMDMLRKERLNNLPEELREVISLTAKLRRKINEKYRHAA